MHVVAINRKQKLAITNEDRACNIAIWIDETGDETDDVDSAVAAIVPLPNGKWETVNLRDFEPVEIQ